MVKPEEFRLGNLIQSDGEYFIIDKIEKNFIGAGALGVHPAGFDLDLAIPLTEEWLLKFGFHLHEESHHKFPSIRDLYDENKIVERLDRLYQFKESSIEDSAGDMDVLVILDPETNNLRSMSIKGVRETFCCADIQFVHQLQNLYFALTGSELTMHPTT